MNCTGEARRIKICKKYDIKPIGCIVLYGGRKVKSDAGGKVITDKYYKFLCIHRDDAHHEFIQCGYPTAKHICELSGIELPSEFNPFTGSGGIAGGVGGGFILKTGVTGKSQNRGRKQLDTAIMLFITLKDSVLEPETPIFKVKERVEEDMYSDVELCDVKAVNTILGRFHTTISQIITDLGLHGKVKNYNFDILIDIIDNNKIVPNNYR